MVLYYARPMDVQSGLTVENVEETFSSLQQKATSVWGDMTDDEKTMIIAIGVGIVLLLVLR